MKKLIFLVVCLLSGGMPVFSQTYQELCDRAVTYTEQDSLPQAEDYIRRAVKLEPSNPHNALLFSNLGTIQRRQRQYEQALESYNFALNIAPRAVPILLNRAAIYMELGRNNLAQADYSLVLDLEKNNEEALLIESVPSLYVIGGAMLIASVANIYFNGISGTGNTQAALILETATLVIYTSYIFWIGYIVKAPVSVCFSTEVIYYALLLICSVIYLKKAKWQNKKI